MFRIDYYNEYGSYLGCDDNLADEFAVGDALKKFARNCQHGDTIRIVNLDDELED